MLLRKIKKNYILSYGLVRTDERRNENRSCEATSGDSSEKTFHEYRLRSFSESNDIHEMFS